LTLSGVLSALITLAPRHGRVAWMQEQLDGAFCEGTDEAWADFCAGGTPDARLMRLVRAAYFKQLRHDLEDPLLQCGHEKDGR
jgi:hypothetical protein